jgi:hypothetical protein
MTYRAYSLALTCNVPLPELPRVPDAPADIRVRVRRGAVESSGSEDWAISIPRPSGRLWLRWRKDADGGFLLRFPDDADFQIDGTGRRIECLALPDAPPAAIRHLLLDNVLPRALTLQGREALHASAVLTPFGVAAFMGAAGAGKSTLASVFLAAGYPVLADDCVVVDRAGGRFIARPGYPGLRLREDAWRRLGRESTPSRRVTQDPQKRRLNLAGVPDAFVAEARPLCRIYALARHEGPEGWHPDPDVELLSWRDAVMSLLHCALRLDLDDRTRSARQFSFYQDVAAEVPVRRLRMPDAADRLSAVRDVILGDLKA